MTKADQAAKRKWMERMRSDPDFRARASRRMADPNDFAALPEPPPGGEEGSMALKEAIERHFGSH